MKETFRTDLQHLINRYSLENGSNTPDFILANYLCDCIASFNRIIQEREKWYGRDQGFGISAIEVKDSPNA